MLIKKQSFIELKIYNGLSRIINFFENNNNAFFYKNGEYQFLKKLFSEYANKSITIFDIGSNIGDYAEILLHLSQKNHTNLNLHLFEPLNQSFAKLKIRFSDKKGLVINNFGASDENCEKEIYFDHNESAHASLYNRKVVKLENKTTVKLMRLDDYIEQQEISKINLAKLDVEGHELSALKGLGKYLSSNFIDFIQFEYGGTYIDSRIHLHDVCELLTNRGFEIFKIKRNSIQPFKYSPVFENFAYSNYVAISHDIL